MRRPQALQLLPAALVAAAVMAALPTAAAASRWGSSYGDPYGFCPWHSFLPRSYGVLATSDPEVGGNPEQATFWGIHPNPGYDDWYGRWYGDWNGRPGADSGWRHLMRVPYRRVGHWNFASYGWSVHGHVKQYIAYHNWTFGGQCGMGGGGSAAGMPPPYMADVYGYPVLDIYVDSVPPYPPQPRVTAVGSSSVDFTWDPVADRGDGAGRDYYEAGMDHYTSWLTVNGGPARDGRSTPWPRVAVARNLGPGDTACLHVRAYDKLGNATPEEVACGRALAPPPMPDLRLDPGRVAANPSAWGLTGLESWFWISPASSPVTSSESWAGRQYTIAATPIEVTWDFGDGATASEPGIDGMGRAYPRPSTIRHLYQAQSAGYRVSARVRYQVSWSIAAAADVPRPVELYPLGQVDAGATPLVYPVRQAQPEVIGFPLNPGRR
ncbi:MAG: fibronectin type III domain-containing protein [Candidatus Dormibacteraceae bacterium]